MASTYSNFRVVVADNASTDDSIPFLRSYYPLVQIIELKKNFGFARGYNEALKDVEGEFYVLLNSDVEVMPSWIEPLVEMMQKNQLIGACQPKLLQQQNRILAAPRWLQPCSWVWSQRCSATAIPCAITASTNVFAYAG